MFKITRKVERRKKTMEKKNSIEIKLNDTITHPYCKLFIFEKKGVIFLTFFANGVRNCFYWYKFVL
jgi:hypothetical protein